MKKIILIVGASGVGKDTLLRYAKMELGDNENYNFVNRYITRKADENESNFFIEEEAFNILNQNNYFISSWFAHTNCYGIAQNSIIDGINIISISRAHIKDFEIMYDNITTIHVSIPKLMLLERLRLRGRENESQIMSRIKRAYEMIRAKDLIEFENIYSIEKSTKKFIKLLKKFENNI